MPRPFSITLGAHLLAASTWAQDVPVISEAPLLGVEAEDVVGTSVLRRYPDRLELTIDTGGPGVVEGHVISIWWAVFNEPERCLTRPCGLDDMFAKDDNHARADLMGSAGAVIEETGVLRLESSLELGGQERSARPHHKEAFGNGDGIPVGLLHPLRAEVHIVLRSHGPVNEAFLEEQLSTFGGGCFVNLPWGELPRSAGECGDISAAEHAPPVATSVPAATWGALKAVPKRRQNP